MSYAFLKKAKTQPDLLDFCEYINKPLMILEDILHRYQELELNKKVTTENLEIYHKCDSILQKHLPDMVDNFCNFSFEYRNNERIDIDHDTSLTPKELLLKNLAKIIEEVKLIEKEFNRNNSFQTLVQTKVLSNYGFQPELSLETGKIKKDSIELNNKFDYEKFVKDHEFKKPSLINPIENNIPVEPIKKKAETNTESNIEGNDPIFQLVLMIFGLISLMVLSILAFMAKYSHESNKNFEAKLQNIELKINKNYDKSMLNEISNEMLIASRVLTEDELKTPWGSTVLINNDDVKKDGAYSLTFSMVTNNSQKKNYSGDACENVAHVVNNYAKVKLGRYVIKSKNDISNGDFVSYCEGKNYSVFPELMKPASSVTLISK